MRPVSVISLLIIFLTSSFSTAAQLPSSPEIPQARTEEEVRAFIEEYKNRLVAMDVDAFMALFSEKGVENRMLPYADIRESYRRTVARSRSLYYHVRIHFIQNSGQGVFAAGRYHLVQHYKRGIRTEFLVGSIQFHLVRENGSLKIKEINYGRDR